MKELPSILCMLFGVVTVIVSLVLFFEMQDNRSLRQDNRNLQADLNSIRDEIKEMADMRTDFGQQRERDRLEIAELAARVKELGDSENPMAAGQSTPYMTRAYSGGKYVGQAWIVPSLVPGENGDTSVVPVIQLETNQKPVTNVARDENSETQTPTETVVYNYPSQHYYNTGVYWTVPYYYGSTSSRPAKPSQPTRPQDPSMENNTTVVPVSGNTPWMPASRVVPVQPPAVSYLNNSRNRGNNYSAPRAIGNSSGFIAPSGQTRPQVLGTSAGSIKTLR